MITMNKSTFALKVAELYLDKIKHKTELNNKMEQTKIEDNESIQDWDFSTKEKKENTMYLKNPDVEKEIKFVVQRVVKNKNTNFTNKSTKEEFNIGLKCPDGSYLRVDIISMENKIYTINSWEIYHKLLSKHADRKGLLVKYVEEKGTPTGAIITIKRNYDTSHSKLKIPDLMKIKGMTELEAKKYQEEIMSAHNLSKIFTVSVE